MTPTPVKDADRFPVMPLKNSVLFPEMMMPLMAGRSASVAALEDASSSEDKLLVIVSQKDPNVDEPKFDDLFQVGTLGVIKRLERGQGGVQAIVQGQHRVELTGTESETIFLQAHIKRLPPPDDAGTEVEALHRTVLEQAAKVLEMLGPQAQQGLSQVLNQLQDPLHLAYWIGSVLPLGVEKEQALLAANTRAEALRLTLDYLSHEVQVLELRHKIATQAHSEMSREQREYLLRQQLRAIREELGESDPEQAELADLRRQLSETDLPGEVAEEARRELDRLGRIPSASPEHQLTRTYIELIIELPWKTRTEDILDLTRAQQVLDEDHYNLSDVKERIIEHLAVLKLNPRAKAPILCFVGPPGVGKTSLGKSIARALGREFERMSLGGLHDEAELRGHRRTYIGAMPGRIIQAIRRASVKNPLLMLDEIDKVGRDFRGDPTSALLEILDPAQNNEFRDNYLDLEFDLSEVFFITTANTLETIPQPLLDRMEVLWLSGYTDEEKMRIAKQYLIRRETSEAGLDNDQLTIPDATLSQIIRRYTREAGVRELQRTIGRLARKVAMRVAKGETAAVVVQPAELSELLGRQKFFEEDVRKELSAGVAAGLAYTPTGGAVLYVEVMLLPSGGGVKLTGKLGDVMKESAEAAQSFVVGWAEQLDVDREKLQQGIHIHVPAGATPKDGPSAGVTIATALASAYTGHPVRSDTAMTGEITLSGLVLPVGGIKEKVLAAHRSRLLRVILPKQNEQDLDDLPDHVRDDMEFVLAEHINDVLAEAIPDLAVVAPQAI